MIAYDDLVDHDFSLLSSYIFYNVMDILILALW